MSQIMSMGYGDALTALALLALWPIILVIVIAVMRVMMVAQGGTDPSTFKSGVEHGPARYWRLNRAHLNTQENLGIIAAVVLAAVLSGYDADMLATLMWVVLGARIVQSISQVISGEGMLVNVRFAAYLVQLVCLIIVIFGVVTA